VEAEGGASEVRVDVRDLGPGIAPQHQTRVFERFWRADRSGATPPGPPADPSPAAGLGLAICKRIVEHHGGAIRITSNQPRGACVTVTLPPRPAGGAPEVGGG
jgi:signal transduction histidine kinase